MDDTLTNNKKYHNLQNNSRNKFDTNFSKENSNYLILDKLKSFYSLKTLIPPLHQNNKAAVLDIFKDILSDILDKIFYQDEKDLLNIEINQATERNKNIRLNSIQVKDHTMSITDEEKSKREIINENLNDGWSFKFDEKFFKDAKRQFRRKRKKILSESEKLLPKILIDFVNPRDIKRGYRKNIFKKSNTLHPILYKNLEEKLLNKNSKYLKLDVSQCYSDDTRKIDTTRIQFNCEKIKYSNSLFRSKLKFRENWKMIYNNPDIEENIKIKFMGIQSNKDQLKNKIEEKTIDFISNILNDELNKDKNNKLSKELTKLYREEKYDIEIDEHTIKENTPICHFIGGKTKLFKENKQYLISIYFDIYQDILNDVFNSKNSLFEFNESKKGKTIMENFRIISKIRPAFLHRTTIARQSIIKKFETLTHSPKLNKIEDRVNSGHSDKNKGRSKDDEDDDTKSNFDILGFANQTYINNILLRDFGYIENIQNIEKSNSDELNTENCLHTTIYNESLSRVDNSVSENKICENNLNLLKNRSDNSKKFTSKSNLNCNYENENENEGNISSVIQNQQIKKKSTDEFKKKQDNEFDTDENINILKNIKIKKDIKKSKNKSSKFNVLKDKDNLQNDFFYEISKNNYLIF